MEIPYQRLSQEALENLVEEFVLREGTDYGHGEWTLEQKVHGVIQQLRQGRAKVVFDADRETCNIVLIQP